MSLIPQHDWYAFRLEQIRESMDGTTDWIGRPWCQHFERVALRMIFRNATISRDAVEAALYHDALMEGGRGKDALRALGLSERCIEIVERTTPPAHRNNFRDTLPETPEDNLIYLDYIRKIISSGDMDAIHLKLADIRDTIDTLQQSDLPSLKTQLAQRYFPSMQLLSDAAEISIAYHEVAARSA